MSACVRSSSALRISAPSPSRNARDELPETGSLNEAALAITAAPPCALALPAAGLLALALAPSVSGAPPL